MIEYQWYMEQTLQEMLEYMLNKDEYPKEFYDYDY